MPRAQAPVANCSKEEGDEICRMVLKLVKAIRAEQTAIHRPVPEPVPVSPVYRQYEAYVRAAAPRDTTPDPKEAA